MAYILSLLNDIKIPTIHFKGGFVKGVHFSSKGNPDKVDFILKEEENAFCFNAEDISADIDIDRIYYKISFFKFDAEIKYHINKGLNMHQCYQFADQIVHDKRLPALHVKESKIDINSDRSNISIKGNAAAQVLEGLKDLMANNIQKFIGEELSEKIKELAPSVVNKAIAKTDGVVSLKGVKGFDQIAINIEIPQPFIIDSEKMTFEFNGTCFDREGM